MHYVRQFRSQWNNGNDIDNRNNWDIGNQRCSVPIWLWMSDPRKYISSK